MDFSWLSFLWIIPVLGVLVLVHEMGHFFTARLFGIRVEEFGLGLPPRAFAIRRNGIDYSLNWLPIGGFVKILGENGDSDAPDSFGKAPAWQRVIVLAAGVTMNVLSALLLLFAVGVMGENVPKGPPTLTAITENGPAFRAGLKVNDIILAVDGQTLTSNDDLARLLNERRGQQTRLTVDRGGTTQEITAVPNSSGLALEVGLATDSRGPLLVQSLDPSSTAYKNGLRTGDILLAVNGRNVPTLNRLNEALNNVKGNKTVDLLYSRGGERQSAIQADLTTTGLAGVVAQTPVQHVSYSPGEAVSYAFNTTGTLLRAIPESFVQMFTGRAPAGGVAGPIGIAQITGEVSRESGLSGLLRLTAILGVNLALINILPLPALDGGRILFILVNAVLGVLPGKPRISPEREGLVHLVGMGLLLLLIALISLGDIMRLISGASFLPK